MGVYQGNIYMVFGDNDAERSQRFLEFFYGITFEYVQPVSPKAPYAYERRHLGNTLIQIQVPEILPNAPYSLDKLWALLPLREVGLTDEAVARADGIFVLMLDNKDRQRYYYPLHVDPHIGAAYEEESAHSLSDPTFDSEMATV